MDPLISIIVPLYNYKKYIKDCIESILNQTYEEFELIVVDDCSIDGSYESAKKFVKKDKRIKVIKLNKNCGYSKAKNEGIILSRGKYITTLDADDMMTKNSLNIRIRSMLNHNVQFVYANAIKIIGHTTLKQCYKIKNPVSDRSFGLYNIHAQTIMLDREIFKKYGLFDENLRSRSDREMWWRFFGKSEKDEIKISNYYLNKFVAYYRHHRYSMWRKRKRNPKYDKYIIKMSEKAYKIRRKEGATRENTRFLEK